VHITPVSNGVDQLLLFRTAEGTRRSAEMGTQLAFEVEEVTGGFARSVVVSGTAGRLPDDRAERAELTSLIASSPKYDVVNRPLAVA
jgi:hypothetical protein